MAGSPSPRRRKPGPRLSLVASLAAVVILASGLWILWRSGFVEWTWSDGETIRERGRSARPRSVLWTPPREIHPGEAAPGAGAATARLAVEGRSSRGDLDLFLQDLTPAGWSALVPLGGEDSPINTTADEAQPLLAPDGASLLFSSNRPGGLGGFDLYLSRKAEDAWTEPRNLGRRVNSPFDEGSPALHPSGTVLVFATTRPRAFLVSPPDEWTDLAARSWNPQPPDLAWTSREVSESGKERWRRAALLRASSSQGREETAAFSPAGDFLYFSSDRAGGRGGQDLYRARVRLQEDEETGTVLLDVAAVEETGGLLNTSFDERAPQLFLEGFAIRYQVRDPAGVASAAVESRSREVAGEIEIASLPLATLKDNIGRLAALAAGGAALAALLAIFIRHRRLRTLTLLARCASVALLLHAAMLYGFYFWRVGTNLVALASRELEVEVSVEETFAARLALEASRIAGPGTSSEPVDVGLEASSSARRLAAAPADLADAPRPLPLASAPPLLPAVAEIRAPETEDLPEPASTAVALPSPDPVAYRPEPALATLPVPQEEPAEAESASEASPSSAPDTKLAAEILPTEPAALVEAPAASLSPDLADGENEPPALALARTQVQAPVPPDRFLPPLAAPVPEPPALAARLPVPAQAAVREDDVRLEPAALAAKIAAAPPPPAPPAPEEMSAGPLRTEAPTRVLSWESPPLAPAAAGEGLPDVREALAAEVVPASRPLPIAAVRITLPQELPAGEIARAGTEAEASAALLAPRPAERLLLPESAPREKLSAPLAARVPALEARPLTAPAPALTPVHDASPTELAALPAPGALAAAREPPPAAPTKVTATPPPPVAVARRLPEPQGETAPATGKGAAAEPGDIVSPSRGATAPDERLLAHLQPRAPAAQPSGAARAAGPSGVASPSPLGPAPAAVATRGSGTSTSIRPASSPRGAAATLLPPVPPPTAGKDERSRSRSDRKLPELPPELARTSDIKKVRSEETRPALVRELGGSDASEDCVLAALDWLARHQSTDGRWDIDNFDASCRQCRSPGLHSRCDTAITALAVLCFLGQNHTPTNEVSRFHKPVRRGLEWLLHDQRPDGLFGAADTRFTMYGHAMATLAVSEAFILTRDQRYFEPLRSATALILKAQNKRTGGWRYRPEPPLRGDTSVSGWQVLALTSVRDAGVEVPEEAFDLARHWLDAEVASGAYGGIYGYTNANEPRVAMVAEGMYARELLGGRARDRKMEESARYIYTETRRGGHLDNLYLTYYGTLALFHHQGWIWENWNREVRDFLVRTQHRKGALSGSWDPSGPWSEAGGRVLSTCLATLSLEVYYRYLPLYWRAEGGPARK